MNNNNERFASGEWVIHIDIKIWGTVVWETVVGGFPDKADAETCQEVLDSIPDGKIRESREIPFTVSREDGDRLRLLVEGQEVEISISVDIAELAIRGSRSGVHPGSRFEFESAGRKQLTGIGNPVRVAVPETVRHRKKTR